MIYDRGNLKQFIDHRLHVQPKSWIDNPIALPDPKDIPYIDLKVMNYHRPALGTFHSKFVVVDRKYGAVCSNNVMANENLEMMTQLEGPIVRSLFDTSMISWSDELNPQMPSILSPPTYHGCPSFSDTEFTKLIDQQGNFQMPEFTGSAQDSINHERLPTHEPGDSHWDESIAGEVLRSNAAFRPVKEGETHNQLVCDHLNKPTGAKWKPTAPEPADLTNRFTPFIPLPPHDPFPIALVNRKPAGAPHNSSLQVPQNAAWIAALRNAKTNVFIQSPDINAKPLIPEIIAAVKRGVIVKCFFCLGYNDAGELLPGQGGHNDGIAAKMVDELKAEDVETRGRLKIGWYTAKDQIRPIHKNEGGRTCHIKLMIVDGQVGIQGSGNQDTQSWFHSQEVNIMVDSPLVCQVWQKGIDRIQNTGIYGMGCEADGLWYDQDGKQAPHAIGRDAGKWSWGKGVVGAIQRARGIGSVLPTTSLSYSCSFKVSLLPPRSINIMIPY